MEPPEEAGRFSGDDEETAGHVSSGPLCHRARMTRHETPSMGWLAGLLTQRRGNGVLL